MGIITGTVQANSKRTSSRPESFPWWNPELSPLRLENPKEYRRLCRRTRQDFYWDRVESVLDSADLGKILRWRNTPTDDKPTLLRQGNEARTDPEGMADVIAANAFRPPDGPALPPYVHDGPVLPVRLQNRMMAPQPA